MKTNLMGKRRTMTVAVFFSFWVLVIVALLFKVQVLDFVKYSSRVRAQSNRILELNPKRGTIFDRNGEVLAISVQAKSAYISNKNAALSFAVFERFSRKINLPFKQKVNIRKRIRKGERFIWLKRKLTEEEYATLQLLDWNGEEKGVIGTIDEYRRIYPQGRISCHILGGVDVDERGLIGIEKSLDSQIGGKGGKLKVLLDARQKVFQLKYLQPPVPGKDITLTIDSTLQFLIARELERTVREFGAKAGTVIVMDPREGSVLAMVSFPDYSPAGIGSTPPEVQKNLAISFLYDPGSTFKVILASAALESRVCYPQQIFRCFNGTIQVGDRVITDVHPYDRLSFEDIIIHSSNIGATRIGYRLGNKKFFEAIKQFGFGSRTGIELPIEETGIVRPLKEWSHVSLAFLSFGYEIVVTPMQMARAFNVIASGGYMLQPEILKRIEDQDVVPKQARRILSIPTLAAVTEIMNQVVVRGTGQKARIPGLEIAGKTGTTKKVKNGKYTTSYVSSFGGFFPLASPRVTVFVVIDEPSLQYYGGDVAAPFFRAISEKILAQLRIFRLRAEDHDIKL